MNTNSDSRHLAPEKITKLLTRAAEQLDPGTVTALRRARHIALERQHRSKPVFALSSGHHAHWLVPHSTHQWVAAVILLVSVLVGGVGYWNHAREHEMNHLDLAILTDDLPMEVFVDR